MRIPGIYVEVRGDISQLETDLRRAQRLVKEAANTISDEMGNALKPKQVSKGLGSLVSDLSDLSRSAQAAGRSFNGLGADLRELWRMTGVSVTKFDELQSKFLSAEVIRTTERALTDMARAMNLGAQEVMDLGVSFNASEASIKKVLASLNLVGANSYQATKTAAAYREMRSASLDLAQSQNTLSNATGQFEKILLGAEVRAKEAKKALAELSLQAAGGVRGSNSKQFWDAITPSEVPLEDFSKRMTTGFVSMEVAAMRARAVVQEQVALIAGVMAVRSQENYGTLGIQSLQQYREAIQSVRQAYNELSAATTSSSEKLRIDQAYNAQMQQLRDNFFSTAKAAREAKEAIESIGQKKVDAFYGTLGIQSLQQYREAIQAAKKAYAELSATVTSSSEKSRLDKAYKDKIKSLEDAFNGKGFSLIGGKNLLSIFANTAVYGGAYQVLGWLQQMPAAVMSTVAAFDSLRVSYEGIFGTSGGQQFQYAIDTANKYGKSIETVASSYKKFAAATDYVGMSSKQTQKIFESVVQAITKVGGSSTDVEGTLLALQQMISKGTVSAEEFRLQFAERIPGAMKMGADALGVTTAKFKAMMENGEIVASDFLPKLSSQLSTFAEGWEKSAESIESGWERLKNTSTEAIVNLFGIFISDKDVKDIEKRANEIADIINAALKRIKPDSGSEGWPSRLITKARNFTWTSLDVFGSGSMSLKDVFSGVGDYVSRNEEYLKSWKEAAQNTASEIATILAKPADISPESGKYVAELQVKLDKALEVIKALSKEDWTVNFTANVDTSQLERAIKLVDALYKKSAEGGAQLAASQLIEVQKGVAEFQDRIRQIDAINDKSGSSVVSSRLAKERNFIEAELKKTTAAVSEAKANYIKALKQFSNEETATPFDDLNRKSKGDSIEKSLAEEAETYEKAVKKARARFDLDKKTKANLISDSDFQSELQRLASDHEAAVKAIKEKGARKGGTANTAAKQTIQSESYLEQANDQYQQLLAQLNGDTLESKVAGIEKKYDRLASSIKRAMVGAKGDMTDANAALGKLSESKAIEIQIAKLEAWKKSMQTAASNLSKLGQMTGDPNAIYAGQMLQSQLWGYEQQRNINNIEDPNERAKQQNELARLLSLNEVDARKQAYEGIKGVSDKYWFAEQERIQNHLEAVKSSASSELAYKIYAAQQWDAFSKAKMESLVESAQSYAEMFAAKWSLAFGSYKSEMGRARDEWSARSDNIIELNKGLISSVSGGFADFFKKAAKGSATLADLWQYMCDRMLDAVANFVDKAISDQLTRLFSSFGNSGFSLGNVFSGLFGGSSAASPLVSSSSYTSMYLAKGGAFASSTLPVNSIASSPTYFPLSSVGYRTFATGTGVYGEAGPEAIMPLKRSSSGVLGVQATDSKQNKSQNITFNVQNRSGQEIKLSTAKTEQKQNELVVTLLLDAIGRNVGGSRTALQSVLGLK